MQAQATVLRRLLGQSLSPPLSRGIIACASPAQIQAEQAIAADMLAPRCSPGRPGRDYITGVHDALAWVTTQTDTPPC